MSAHGFIKLPPSSKEVVLAAHFNKYGTRLVTGSADHRLRVFDLQDSGDWQRTDVWRGHNAEILDVWPSSLRSATVR
jgi:nucleoporin SEH1